MCVCLWRKYRFLSNVRSNNVLTRNWTFTLVGNINDVRMDRLKSNARTPYIYIVFVITVLIQIRYIENIYDLVEIVNLEEELVPCNNL